MFDKMLSRWYIINRVIFMKKKSILKLLLICAFAAAVYFADMYAMLTPNHSVAVFGERTGVAVEYEASVPK